MIISLIDKTDIRSLNLTFSPSLDSEMLMVIDGRGVYIGLYECSGEERKGLLRDYRFNNENKDNATLRRRPVLFKDPRVMSWWTDNPIRPKARGKYEIIQNISRVQDLKINKIMAF